MSNGRPTRLEIFAFRLFIFLVLVTTLFVAGFFFPSLYRARGNHIKISGLSPKEMVVIEKIPFAAYRLTASVDPIGAAEFNNLPLGDWKVVKGGAPELGEIMIPLRELMGRFTKEGEELNIFPKGNGWYCSESRHLGWPRTFWWECMAFVKEVAGSRIQISLD